ncbi:UMF1 family MFS transporter [Desulfosoma caldarium]|uniref:UMF1 family MFS transporter n=2 Tax=Desulfosoma caldarium TaxID=610254 RepID=A0A3N1VFD7_9BACT|nr:UMF1 family MFS transporter [Desulfosoma caldarium]
MRRLLPNSKAQWAWCLYDWANSAFATSILAVLFPVYFAKVIMPSKGMALHLGFLRWHTQASSLWGYTVSTSLFCVAVIAPWIGRWADLQGKRRPLFLLLAFCGAASTTLLAFTGHGTVWRALACFIVAYACFSASEIFYNAFLPHIASPSQHDWLSGLGYAYGYVGGGLLLALHLIWLHEPRWIGLETTHQVVRFAFFTVGVWWAFFTLPCLLWLPSQTSRPRDTASTQWMPFPVALWKDLWARPRVAAMVVAYFFYNNGIQTVITMASVYGATELGLSTTSLTGAFLMTQWIAFPGATLLSAAAERFGTRRVLFISLAVWCCVVVFAYGMHSPWHFWILAAIVGFILGGSQSLSRSLFSRLIPGEKSAEFFGFFAIGGKFSAILGPLVFGILRDVFGTPRPAILSLVAFFLIGAAMLATVKDDP